MRFITTSTARIAAAGLCFALFSASGQAALLTWELQNATFADPGAAVALTGTGTFTYDPDTHTIGTWDIVVKGDALSGVDFHFSPTTTDCGGSPCTPLASRSPGPTAGTDLFSFLLNSVPDQSASLSLITQTLTDSGGTKPLIDGTGPEFLCCGIALISADVTSGSIAAVPEPASLAWVGLGLIGWIATRRFREASAVT
jgi:hypothetical protein